jgi:hypothetical protein
VTQVWIAEEIDWESSATIGVYDSQEKADAAVVAARAAWQAEHPTWESGYPTPYGYEVTGPWEVL